MRPLFRIRGVRQLQSSEVARLPAAHFGEEAPVVAMPRGAEWGGDSGEAWEVDIPKSTLQLLRAGCGGHSTEDAR